MKNRAFTLIEMMVAVAVFILAVTSISGVFVSGLKAQKQSLAYQELLDQTSYIEEYISRAVRMARKDMAGDCLPAKFNYEKTRGGKGLAFKNYQGVCQEFFWDQTLNRLKEAKGGEEQFLTSEALKIVSFDIELAGEGQADDRQPQVTLFLDIEGGEGANIKIQTTISQRNLDVRK